MSREFRLTHTMTYQGKTINNVYHYTSSSNVVGQADNLCAEFFTQMLNAICAVQNTEVQHVQLYAIDTNTMTDYATYFLTNQGAVGSAPTGLSPFMAWSFTINTTASIIRHGFKRIAGLDETQQEEGLPTSAASTLLDALETKFVTSLSNGGFTFTPVIARYNNANPPVMTAFANATSCSFKRISTQNSRK